MYDDWGPGPPWYEDLFFVIMGIIVVCLILVGIVIFAFTFVLVFAAGIYTALGYMGVVPL